MSADNWAVCPQCREDEDHRITALRDQATATYGKVPANEFDALWAAANKPMDLDALMTFREDYEIYGADTGVVTVSYSGGCTKCEASARIETSAPVLRGSK